MKSFIRLIGSLVAAAVAAPLSAQAAKPNVIFILADDMGWGDLGVFYQNSRGGSPKFATPNLDAMAAEGIQLRRHYCPAPVCAPSRASLLLGVHQGHANVRDNQFDKELENNHTLGSVMKQGGYATAAIGKWGLQGGGLPAPGRPQLRGFDYFFGYLEHGDAHYHYPKETGANFYDGTTDITANLDKCYSTDLIAARAKKWILDQNTANPTQPFFIYLAFTAPHARLDVPTQAYPAGNGESGGLQWTGTPGAMINTASGTINSFIHPDYAAEATWPDYAKRHATMIRRIDDAIADLIQTLKDRGIDDDTLIIFTSDNGPHNEAGSGGSYTYNPTFFDSFGPMDGIKRDTWEGGMREPTLVRWPGHIAAGGLTTAASQFHDWMPTLAEVAGLPAPARSDGVSLLPTLTGTGTQRESTIYVEYNYPGSTPTYSEFEASRRGATRNQEQVIHLEGYKGIRYNVTAATDDFQIYNTLTDPKETTNLAGSNAYFTGLQQRLKDRVLQVRRPGGGVSRPYDSANIPPVTAAGTVAGLAYRAFEGSYPWVPDFTPLAATATGTCAGLDLAVRTRDDQIGLEYTGYLNVPADGSYTLYLNTDSRAFLRLHDASILDADFGYNGGTERSATVNLKAGKHPLRLGYVHGAGGPHALTLQWSGPGITKQAIPAANLLRVSGGPVPPTANPDSATAAAGFASTIAVLANDTLGSGPGPLAVTAVSIPAHGTATLSGSTQIIYTAVGGYTGPDSFTYTVSDGAASAVGTVTITVVAAVPPTANPDRASTAAATPVNIPVLTNDTDDGVPAPLAISGATQPAGGSTVIAGTTITYTPRAGVYGEDPFSYTITDGQASATATVTVTVLPATSTLWLPLDESSGSTVADALGRSLGSLQNLAASPWTAGKLGGALAFDGVDDRVVFTGQKGVTGSAARTITFWLNASAVQTGGTRPTMVSWGAGNGTTAGTRFDINLNHTNNYQLRAEFNSSGLNFSTATRTDLRGAGWVHCAIVVPAGATVSQILGFLDGVPATSVIEPAGSGGTVINTTALNDISLGRIADGTAARVLTGLLDDVRIYPHALAAAEIAALAARSPDETLQDQWFFQHSGNPAPTVSEWSSNTDGDAYNGWLEFALGGNPTTPSTGIAPVLTDTLAFVFNRRRDGLAASAYVPEVSETLGAGSWTPFGTPVVAPHPTLAGFDRVAVTLPTTASPCQFVRLRVAP